MHRTKHHVLLAAVAAVLAATLLLSDSRQAVAQGREEGLVSVSVANTPLPVVQSGPWKVALSGPPNVTIAGRPVVALANSAASPVYVRDVGGAVPQPFHESATMRLDGLGVGSITFFTVPAGKRAVIEFFSLHARLPREQSLTEVSITTVVNGRGRPHYFPVFRQGEEGSGLEVLACSHMVRMYADPRTPVALNVMRTASTGPAVINAQISGYYADLQ